MAKYIFKETQRFTQLWIWLILVFVLGVFFVAVFATSSILEKEFAIEIPLAIIGFVILLFILMRLETTIDSTFLSFSYFPFVREKKFAFKEIESMELQEYNSLWEYGGWGVRYNFDSWAYNTGGKYGIMIQTRHKKFLIGTRKPEEVRKAISMFEVYKSKNHGS